MNRLQKKIKSESGASILLAMLMFLVCAVVAASIVAAASANAGKLRGNIAEQQKELALTSAIKIVGEELNNTTYIPKYEITTWSNKTTNYYNIKQLSGDYICGKNLSESQQAALTNDLLPLKNGLNAMFARSFNRPGMSPLSNASDIEDISSPIIFTLRVALPDNLDGYSFATDPADLNPYKLSQFVTVNVILNNNTWNLTLHAFLGNDEASATNTMKAEMLVQNPPKLNIPSGIRSYTPSDELPSGSGATIKKTIPEQAPLTWKLNWIDVGAQL